LRFLQQAEAVILRSEQESILDNFLDEMLDFLNDEDEEIRSFTMLFIASAA
jgi:CRISPR/Cas system CSM-associated protein Csm2 small subunit